MMVLPYRTPAKASNVIPRITPKTRGKIFVFLLPVSTVGSVADCFWCDDDVEFLGLGGMGTGASTSASLGKFPTDTDRPVSDFPQYSQYTESGSNILPQKGQGILAWSKEVAVS
jgi:hypothetical protein